MDVDAARRHAGLKPLPQPDEPAEPKKERGHGRRSQREVLHVVGGSPELRGVPLIGTGPGAIDGTRPGHGTVADLEQAGRDIVHANLTLAKAKAERLREVRRNLKQGTPPLRA